MKRIKPISRGAVSPAHVNQGLILSLLEKVLVDLLGQVFGSKDEEPAA